jgi:23S rRNA (adenine2030-N6)-methyltransferase
MNADEVPSVMCGPEAATLYRMNYRHAFHAGNHADVLKHLVLIALLDALQRKEGALFVLDTHAGRGMYSLQADPAQKTGEAEEGVLGLARAARVLRSTAQDAQEQPLPTALARYLEAIRAANPEGGLLNYPGSPWLIAQALRAQDRLACCELQAEEAEALRALLRGDARCGVHQRDGYAALHALLPPKEKRGLVLIDPPFEAQIGEFDAAIPALRDALQRWPQGCYALWYPIKRRRELARVWRRAADLPSRGACTVELLVRRDDSPLRMNGSGLLLLNPPWQLDTAIEPALRAVLDALDQGGGSLAITWLKEPV